MALNNIFITTILRENQNCPCETEDLYTKKERCDTSPFLLETIGLWPETDSRFLLLTIPFRSTVLIRGCGHTGSQAGPRLGSSRLLRLRSTLRRLLALRRRS